MSFQKLNDYKTLLSNTMTNVIKIFKHDNDHKHNKNANSSLHVNSSNVYTKPTFTFMEKFKVENCLKN